MTRYVNIYTDAAGQEYALETVFTSWDDAIDDVIECQDHPMMPGHKYVCTLGNNGTRNITFDDVAERKQEYADDLNHVAMESRALRNGI